MLYWHLKDMFASSICSSPVKGIADTLFHLVNFFISELFKLDLALVL